MLGLRFRVGPIMYISVVVTDQDLHLGLLESPHLSLFGCVPHQGLSLRPHTRYKLCDSYLCTRLVT